MVRRLCNTTWSAVCTTPTGQRPGSYSVIMQQDYFSFLQRFTFVTCAHGGGIDPNPKLFTALLAGVIPIIRSFPGDSMYDGWPIVRLNSWSDFPDGSAAEQRQVLQQWRDRLAPHYADEQLRKVVLSRMKANYWWSKVRQHLSE